MWNNDASGKETLEEFYIKTDPDNHYFKALLKEIPLEEIEKHTQKRAEVYMQELKDLLKDGLCIRTKRYWAKVLIKELVQELQI